MTEKTVSRFRTGVFPSAVFQAATVFALAVLLAFTVNRFRGDGILWMADWSPEARLKAATGDRLVIPLDQAVAFFDTREATFVDARSPELFSQGHIRGSLNVPWEQVNDYLDRFFEKVPGSNAIVITYCDGKSCSLSEHLALMLRDMGYKNAMVLVNGWTVWMEHQYPVERGNGHGS